MSRLDTEPAVAPQQWRVEAQRAHGEGCTYLDWLTAVDQTDASPAGFDVVARLLDVASPGRWRARVLRTRVAPGIALESLTPLYAGAAWYEREVYEMFGVEFAGFDDGTGQGLRRLLLAGSVQQTPLRKTSFLAARGEREWPGAEDPAATESGSADGLAGRRRLSPPGVPPPASQAAGDSPRRGGAGAFRSSSGGATDTGVPTPNGQHELRDER